MIVVSLVGWRKAVALFFRILVLLIFLGLLLPRLLGLLGEPVFPRLPRERYYPLTLSQGIFQRLDAIILEWRASWEQNRKK
ncbi:MAG: hypothetical protein M1299_02485 [Firmicutes bacterium]|nr:hypothetical protein [Bacillota bacterium]MCL5038692.1 hypothetical protein [Bacillota bacterium]